MIRIAQFVCICLIILLADKLCFAIKTINPNQILPCIFTNTAITAESEDLFELATLMLLRTSSPRVDGEHHQLLRGLRQLKDPDLAPLFNVLSQSDDRTIRINSILGLAEISDNGKIDVMKLSCIDSYRERGEILLEAINLDLIGHEQYLQILQWPDIDDSMLISVYTVLISMNENVATDPLRKLMLESDSPGIRVWAALLLNHLDASAETESAINSINELPEMLRKRTIISILLAVRRHPITGISNWAVELAQNQNESADTRFEAITTLLKINPQTGQELWLNSYKSTTGLVDKLRHVLVLLDVVQNVSADTFTPVIKEENELLQLLGQTGAAIAAGSDGVELCKSLIGQHYKHSSNWVLQYAQNTENKQTAISLLDALIDDTMDDGHAMNDRLEVGCRAADTLLSLDASSLKSLLHKAHSQQRRLTEEAILLGALRSINPEALQIITDIDKWTSTRAGSLALLIKARYTKALNNDDIYRLTLIFQRASGVSPAYEIQAAWLYLKHIGRSREALTTVIAEIVPDK